MNRAKLATLMALGLALNSGDMANEIGSTRDQKDDSEFVKRSNALKALGKERLVYNGNNILASVTKEG